MRVVVSEFMDETALTNFGDGYTVNYDPGLVDNPARLLEALSDADAIIVRNRTLVNVEFLNAAPKLKVVGRLGVGLDNIDLDACKERGVEVCPAVGANTLSVVEYVIGTAMALTRTAYASNDAMIAGEWPRGVLGNGGEVSGRTIGLFGFGGIAQAVAKHAISFGMSVAAFDPYLPKDHPAWEGIKNCTTDELLGLADILSLHVPLTKETADMIDAVAISKMKSGAVLINTARGGIVDENAVVAALKSGKLGGAALDVFAAEPLTAEAGAKFSDTPNLILTPHIAGVTFEGNTRVSFVTVENVMHVLNGG
ncbi:3-phosphoglycerate dehydrogenase [Rhodobacterales bacterium 52_120_T64]|nr:3-phosphoglycerate dehydrogenase [Rhodobacterales bacterium 52_120_T64]